MKIPTTELIDTWISKAAHLGVDYAEQVHLELRAFLAAQPIVRENEALTMALAGEICVRRLQQGKSIVLPGVGRLTSTMRRVRTVKSPAEGGVQQIRVRYARLVGSVIPEVTSGE